MATGNDIVTIAAGEIGKPYVYGTAGPNEFDCSGLTEWAAAQVGISLPHNAAEQQRVTTPVTNPVPGDLVFFGQPAYHVGIYTGNGQMISAPHAGATVHQTSVGNPTGYGRIKGLSLVSTVLSTVTDVLPTGWADDLATRFQSGAMLTVFVLGGLALAGYGLWHTLAPGTRQSLTRQAKEALP